MDKIKLVDMLSRERVVEHIIARLVPDPVMRDDLAQDVYVALMNYNEETLARVIKVNKINSLIFAIAKNMYINKAGKFFKKYRQQYETIDENRY